MLYKVDGWICPNFCQAYLLCIFLARTRDCYDPMPFYNELMRDPEFAVTLKVQHGSEEEEEEEAGGSRKRKQV